MIWKSIGLAALAAAALCPAAAASRYGSWSASDLGDYTEAHTSNESGSVFGLLCGKACIFFVNMQRPCEQGHDYPAMMNSEAGAVPINLRCFVLDDDYVLTFAGDEEHETMFKAGGTVGFAVPLSGGQFGVSRFSLSGSYQAVEAAVDMAERKGGERREGLRDFAI